MFPPLTQVEICIYGMDSRNAIISTPKFDALSNGELLVSLQALYHAHILIFDGKFHFLTA
jgi:hypothetical protein